jgi:hypothetical protein
MVAWEANAWEETCHTQLTSRIDMIHHQTKQATEGLRRHHYATHLLHERQVGRDEVLVGEETDQRTEGPRPQLADDRQRRRRRGHRPVARR